MTIGVSMTAMPAMTIRLTITAVAVLAKRRLVSRYVEPCASGKLPSSAPTMYQSRTFRACQPNSACTLSLSVPSMNVITPIVHHIR